MSQVESFSLSKFSAKKMKKSDFDSISERMIDKELSQQLKTHLNMFDDDFQEAFAKEGMEIFNKGLEINYNKNPKNKKTFKPLKAIKLIPENIDYLENEDENLSLQRLNREKSFNSSLFVKTGDNYLFAVMEKEKLNKKTKDPDKVRIFDLITFFDAVNLLKDEFKKAVDKNTVNKDSVFKQYFEKKKDAKLLFTLKQGDVVYMPAKNEEVILDSDSPLYESFWRNYKERSGNIYIVQKFSGNEIYFIKHTVARPIKKAIEFGSQDCYQKIGDRSIKEYCIKINIDRLGNIIVE